MNQHSVVRSLLVGILISVVFGSVGGPGTRSAQLTRRNRAAPSVYLSFRDLVDAKKIQSEQSIGDGFRFVLHNNTSVAIYYYAVARAPLPGDVPMIYHTENQSGCPGDAAWIGDMLTTAALPAGKAVSFVVPRNHLSEGGKVYVEYTYSWERINGRLVHPDEPVHRAYFTLADLPDPKK